MKPWSSRQFARTVLGTKVCAFFATRPNIIKLKAVGVDEAQRINGLLLERFEQSLVDRISSWRLLKKSSPLSLSRRLREDRQCKHRQLFGEQTQVLAHMAAALEYLHARKIVYSDLKPENCGFIDGKLKLFDLGGALDVSNAKAVTFLLGTHPPYCAPEVARGMKCGIASDIYSLAFVGWEVLKLQEPFCDMIESEYIDQIIHRNRRPKLGIAWPKELKMLLESCWAFDQESRPSAVHCP